ncbi:PqqD family protein [Pseudarthrobacter sp. NIBRBAC000502770]|uniref:PqqD family protein n=1 Tax=Pseudarthrobacter sp. NIBRBAC000502770 TaxID=2590785 RepID=UPI001FED3305|nr:PqqD family protein [Pseudarthrobacter sp. NIBRBAC000502770]
MTSAGITGSARSAWQQRLFDELARGGDLLCLKIMGQRFVVRWGRAVTWQQRASMSIAWARCISGSLEPLLPPEPMEPTEDRQFTASVTCAAMQYGDGTFHIGAASFDELAENLTSRLTVSAILANAGELTMLHACGVGDPGTGAVVALVAKSGTGKTTAASVLARTYGYVTDETVAIAWDGSVVPYPKPLSVKQEAGAPKRQAGPDEFGLQPAPAMPFIQSIVLLDRVQGERPAAPVLKRVPLADALLALIPESSSQAEFVDPLQSLCRLIESVRGVWQVTYSEAADLPAALEPLFQLQARPEPEWEPVAEEHPQRAPLPAGCIRRRAPKDAVKIGSDLLVMLDQDIVRLSGIGPAIWEACSGPVGLDQLTEHVAKVHGKPEGYRAAVAQAVEQLIATSILECGEN